MDKWYKMDVLRNVTGPYDLERIKEFARKGMKFRVSVPDAREWLPIDALHAFLSKSIGSSGEISETELQTYLLERSINELIGLCKGILSDGRVDAQEVDFLKSWFENNQGVVNIWPANILSERINKILADGEADAVEREHLALLMAKLTGVIPGVADAEQLATRLPVDDPPPEVVFKKKSFHLTGNFIFGSREKCEEVIQGLGGKTQPQPEFKTNFLVIGALGSAEWSHGPYGEEVKTVIENRDKGAKTAIISEEHWTFYLDLVKRAQPASPPRGPSASGR